MRSDFTITIRGTGTHGSGNVDVDVDALAAELVAKLRASGAKVHSARFCTPDEPSAPIAHAETSDAMR